jgi:hypothetical protein
MHTHFLRFSLEMTSTRPVTRKVFYVSGPEGKIVSKTPVPDNKPAKAFYEMIDWATTMGDTEMAEAKSAEIQSAALNKFAERFNYADWMLYLTLDDQVCRRNLQCNLITSSTESRSRPTIPPSVHEV